ncbi:hypothetical protein MTR_0029s0040 [Medicago truncatula]|uniref:Uncharacterized protein n=1 Tax=Medicago truncatula TaxID=3880 RepID=A0A072TIL4_MEDTR|nr:hypothetical protein MTR_0029s0040 [Medicago truncatula]
MKSTITHIIANVSRVGNLTKLATGSAIRDFTVLKSYGSPPPQILHWITCNNDGAALGTIGQAACAGIFRNRNEESLGCFAVNLGIENAFYAELMGVIFVVECAIQKRWTHI